MSERIDTPISMLEKRDWRLVSGPDLTELLDAVRAHLDQLPGGIYTEETLRLIRAYNSFCPNPEPVAADE